MDIKLIRKENPLNSYFELDEDTFKYFKEKVKVDYLQELIYMSQYYLGEGLVEKAHDMINSLNDDDFEIYVEKTSRKYASWLNDADGHGGSCICSPGTCPKCYAEGILGVDSIEGVDKYMGSQMAMAFYRHSSINKAIENLKVPYNVTDETVQRWQDSRTKALEWLMEYKQKYFPTE